MGCSPSDRFGIRTLRAVMDPGRWYTFEDLYQLVHLTIEPERASHHFLSSSQNMNDTQRRHAAEKGISHHITKKAKQHSMTEIVEKGRRFLCRAAINSYTSSHARDIAPVMKRKGRWPHTQYMMVRLPCPCCSSATDYTDIKDGYCRRCRNVRKKAKL